VHPELDHARFPTVAEYLAGLPQGLDSHPACLAKASLYRGLLDDCPLVDRAGLPAVLVDLVEHMRPVNTWIPEVQSHAVLLAVYDRSFADEQRFAAFCFEAQRRLWRSKIYSMLMRWTSPQRLLATASKRWEVFHRGSSLHAEAFTEGRATLHLEHPPGLYDRVSRVGLTEGLRAALSMTTQYTSSLVPLDASPTGARWAASWSPR
jgi:hypothetical protein